MADPGDADLRAELAFLLEIPIKCVGATTATIRSLIASLDATGSKEAPSGQEVESKDRELLRVAESDGPVIRFVLEKLSRRSRGRGFRHPS